MCAAYATQIDGTNSSREFTTIYIYSWQQYYKCWCRHVIWDPATSLPPIESSVSKHIVARQRNGGSQKNVESTQYSVIRSVQTLTRVVVSDVD